MLFQQCQGDLLLFAQRCVQAKPKIYAPVFTPGVPIGRSSTTRPHADLPFNFS